jgi:hypothetical protein
MNSADRFQQPAVEDGEDREDGRELDVSRRTRTRTTKRFEIGFFIRRIRNGEVIFYKTFPAYKDKREDEQLVVQRSMMMSAPASAPGTGDEDEEPTIQPMGGPGQPDPDLGPVGGTSTKTEIGVFAGTTTVTTTTTDDD